MFTFWCRIKLGKGLKEHGKDRIRDVRAFNTKDKITKDSLHVVWNNKFMLKDFKIRMISNFIQGAEKVCESSLDIRGCTTF